MSISSELKVNEIASLSCKEFRNTNKVLCMIEYKNDTKQSMWLLKEEYQELEAKVNGK